MDGWMNGWMDIRAPELEHFDLYLKCVGAFAEQLQPKAIPPFSRFSHP